MERSSPIGATARIPSPDDPLVGRVLDERYRVVALLGAGGMGRVYLAVQLGEERLVALKILPPTLFDSSAAETTKRFEREASVTAQLDHPNTVKVHDYGCSEDGVFFIAMEYLEGRTLARLLAEGPLPPARAIGIARQIARSIGQAHELGLVHRDLKPSNVMLLARPDAPDFVKVLDFGLARFFEGAQADASHTGGFFGSPHYVAPEQARSERPAPQADVYSLGAILYEMVTGQLPYQGATAIALLLEQQRSEPKRPRLIDPAIPEALEQVILRALHRERAQRYGSMDELLAALEWAEGAVSVPPAEETAPLLTAADVARIRSTPRSRKVLRVAALGLLGAALTGAGWWCLGS